MADQAKDKKTELFDGGDDERFLLTSKTAIANVLIDLSKRPDILTAYFNHGKEYILTAVLAVMPERNLLVLDYGADERLNQRLLEYGRAVCVTRHDNISIKFGCNILQRAKFQERQALAASLPETLFRQQRREFFRVTLPVVNAIKCHIPRPEQEPQALNMIDISCGGIGLIDPLRRFAPEVGTLLPGCRVDLPEEGVIHANVEIRNRLPLDSRQGTYRIGCRLLNLDSRSNAAILRYIHRVELERRKVRKDSDK